MSNTLMHYGVLGMKWGRRKAKTTSSSSTKRKVSEMSDAELRQAINRFQMEKQYKQLSTREKSRGEKFVIDVLTNAAKQTATNYASKYMTKGVEALIKANIK